MAKTKIGWSDAVWNPVTGCTRVSPGCDNCYMFALYPRLHEMGVKGYEAAPDVVQLIPERLAQPPRWRKPRMVFVNSMSDLFHPEVVKSGFVDKVFFSMAVAKQHIFQVLTKRPGRAAAWWEQSGKDLLGEWPRHVWMGTSVENQKYAPRVRVMRRIPAAVRFVSAEPLLGPLTLAEWLVDGTLQWLIAGGESGPHARPMDLNWARQLRDECVDADVPFFFKQIGGQRDKRDGDKAILDGRTWTEWPKTN